MRVGRRVRVASTVRGGSVWFVRSSQSSMFDDCQISDSVSFHLSSAKDRCQRKRRTHTLKNSEFHTQAHTHTTPARNALENIFEKFPSPAKKSQSFEIWAREVKNIKWESIAANWDNWDTDFVLKIALNPIPRKPKIENPKPVENRR